MKPFLRQQTAHSTQQTQSLNSQGTNSQSSYQKHNKDSGPNPAAATMGFKLAHLYTAPAVNPVTLKARSIPFFNPVDVYGRVFFFSWFGFMIAFWAWYTFPPLVWPTPPPPTLTAEHGERQDESRLTRSLGS